MRKSGRPDLRAREVESRHAAQKLYFPFAPLEGSLHEPRIADDGAGT
jgi:hypothetical protein